MAHIKLGEHRTGETPREWLRVGREIADFTNKNALRDDIVAYVGGGAGGQAPACFNPQIAEVEVNVEVAFGKEMNPDLIGDINTRATQYEFPVATGALLHEAYHARFSQWSMLKAFEELERDEYEALMLLEEGRIEAQGLRVNRKARPFLRACAMTIVIGDAKEGLETQQPTKAITNLVGLLHARVIAGVLDKHEVSELMDWVEKEISRDIVVSLVEIASMAQAHDNHKDATELYPLAKEWARIVREIAKERGDATPEGVKLPEELMEAIKDMLSEIGENVELNNFDELADQEQQEDWKEEAKAKESNAKERAENREVAVRIFDKGTGPGESATGSRLQETRDPNPAERAAAVIIGNALAKAKYRERDETVVSSATPPGRLRTRAIIQNKALRERKMLATENPFRKTVRKHTDEPTLKVGVMVDISGSMGSAMNPMATTAWVMAEATNRIQGKCAMVYYGSDVFATLKAGQRLPQVNVYSAPDGTEKFNKAFKAIDGALDLLHGNGAKLLVIVSDGQYTYDESELAKEAIQKCKASGVAVLWLPFDNGAGARAIGQGYAEVLTDVRNPEEAADAIGKSAMKVISKVGQRAIA
jgi:hypothetical protein